MIPRVATDPKHRVGGSEYTQLRHSRDADDHRTGFAQPGDHRMGGCGRDIPGNRDVVLDGDRDAGKRKPSSIGTSIHRSGLDQRLLGAHQLEGANVVRFDAAKGGSGGVKSRSRASAHICGKLHCGGESHPIIVGPRSGVSSVAPSEPTLDGVEVRVRSGQTQGEERDAAVEERGGICLASTAQFV
mgnify:CR=1 FL=1